jgi:hypothetical protein
MVARTGNNTYSIPSRVNPGENNGLRPPTA